MENAKTRKRFSVITDDVKLRHTTHWDLDFLSRAELDAAMGGDPGADDTDRPDPPVKPEKDG